MKTITVTLGGKSCTINELPRKQNAAWREQFQAAFSDAAGLLEELSHADLTPEAVSDLFHQIVAKVGGSVDMLAQMVFAYAPSLAAERETLEEEAYDSEFMAAFTAVLQLAYPFGSVVETVMRLTEPGRKAD